jgi:hypothetical protein
VLWVGFFLPYLGRALQAPVFALPAGLLLAALGLRAIARLRRRGTA